MFKSDSCLVIYANCICTKKKNQVVNTLEFPSFVNFGRVAWCITVGAKGMHSVCVCEYHQNVKLLLDSLPRAKLDHKSLMTKLVCDVNERNCMLYRCEKCPGSDSLREHLKSVFSERSIEEDDELTFKQWTHTDGTRLITRQEFACDLAFGGDRFAN